MTTAALGDHTTGGAPSSSSLDTSDKHHHHQQTMTQKIMGVTLPEGFWVLCGCTAGIMGFFLVYGVIQERIMTQPYGENNEKFKDTAFLVLCNRLVAIVFALCMIYRNNENVQNTAPIKNYMMVSVSNFLATYCQYEALKYVTFPTQTLGKCGKMIPVLVWGSLMYRKEYSFKDYAIAFTVMIGCTLFLTMGEISDSHGSESNSLFGLILVGLYLFFDGFTSTFQERLFKGYSMSTYNQMLYVNLCSAGLSLFALIPGGNLTTAFSFASRNPGMIRDAIVLSLAASLGQMVIYFTIHRFGALTYSTIMTTRQFASMLLSSILFLHAINMSQWAGVVLVFAALYYQGFSGDGKAKHGHGAPSSADKGEKPVLPVTSKDAIEMESFETTPQAGKA